MPLPDEEIRQRLTAFAARWSVYDRGERSEAQTFVNDLFACYGTQRIDVATFEEPQAGRFLDVIWPRVCIIEMKAPAEANRLERHRDQALDYWRNAADPAAVIPAPRYVVICAFRKLEIWQPGLFPREPRLILDLRELPEHYDALLFLAGRRPEFVGGHVAVTRQAVVHVTDLYQHLKERRAAGPEVLRDFVLQCVWCLFAEDLGQLPAHVFTSITEDLIAHPDRSSADDLGQLFDHLNDPSPQRPTHGLYQGVPYVDGGLFESPTRVHLEPDELHLLRMAAGFNWRFVEPAIFGSLLEGGVARDQQHDLGAHYTHEADIQKVVQPTIVEPWRQRIENVSTLAEATRAQDDLLRFVVLDPACGSGNFLYVAYRALRHLESRLAERERELRRNAGLREQQRILFFPLQNIRGIEIDSFAVSLARVTLWMAHKLAVDELEIEELTLPLGDLSGIQRGDALRMPWPRADAIIGNPPFHGSQNLRRVLGDAYVEWLKSEFQVGIKDYCVYWFRKAHDQLADGDRAGLVGTNSISQNRARGASLDYIASTGGVLTTAVSTQDWPGEAAVDVSIVNWVKNPPEAPTRFLLDGDAVSGITPSLRADQGVDDPKPLASNADMSFQGPIPAGSGFVLPAQEADRLLADRRADYKIVVRPYLVGDDIASDQHQAPRRWIIDFATLTLEEATKFPAAIAIVRERVRPVRERNNREAYRRYWWRFAEPRPAMRAALRPLHRYIGGTATGKRILFCWVEPWTCPSNLTNVFAFEDDYAMGVLCSAIHHEWARQQSSTLEDRIRYTPTSAFDTFPWPDPTTQHQRAAIAEAGRAVVDRRSDICIQERIGLTTLYNRVDEGAWSDLRQLHRRLDAAVAAAYGWSVGDAHDSATTNDLLLSLNARIAAGELPYDPKFSTD